MAKYGNFVYGGATYGMAPKLAYSVEPMSLTVLTFTSCSVAWQYPVGNFTKIRLVRNQNGFSETAEDGVIIWEENAVEGTVTRGSYGDGVLNPTQIPIIPGRQVYYSMFLFTSDKVWVRAGQITDTIPSDHNSQKILMELLPRVYTSAEQNPLGTVTPASVIYNFLDGFALTYDQMLTMADLLRPLHSGEDSPSSLLVTESYGLGFVPEVSLPIKNQKKLNRESFFMYSHKGLKSGLETYAESLTNYSPTTSISQNLLLTVQDSTFYNSTGNWTSTNATLSSVTEQVPTSNSNNIDAAYTCKVTAAGASTMNLGKDFPITKGVPVNKSTVYTMSFEIKSPPSSGSVTPSITFYDKNGTALTTSTGSVVSANNTWKQGKVTATSDASASYAGISLAFSSAGTYYVDMVCVQTGSVVSYDEARAITLFVDANKTNYIKNPSFEVNTTDSWTAVGSPTVSQNLDVPTDAYSGSNSAKIIGDGPWSLTSNTAPIVNGQYYTGSLYLKSNSETTLSLIFKDDASAVVETYELIIPVTSSWTRYSLPTLDGSLSTATTVELVLAGVDGTTYLDCVQLERSPFATDYFDGSLPSYFGSIWENTANNSYSHLYYSKDVKMQRLAETMGDWVPMNAFWRLTSYAGLEYTNLTV